LNTKGKSKAREGRERVDDNQRGSEHLKSKDNKLKKKGITGGEKNGRGVEGVNTLEGSRSCPSKKNGWGVELSRGKKKKSRERRRRTPRKTTRTNVLQRGKGRKRAENGKR